jgi:hypothetical protein
MVKSMVFKLSLHNTPSAYQICHHVGRQHLCWIPERLSAPRICLLEQVNQIMQRFAIALNPYCGKDGAES